MRPAPAGVAPRRGAWIETVSAPGLKRRSAIHYMPHLMSHPVGVRGLKPSSWRYDYGAEHQSHPVGVRGLKLCSKLHYFLLCCFVAPRRGAWIETSWLKGIRFPLLWRLSHPVGVRGLKLASWTCGDTLYMSHPVGVRGLKHLFHRRINTATYVAPRRGAWIETNGSRNGEHRPPRGVAPRRGAWIETKFFECYGYFI